MAPENNGDTFMDPRQHISPQRALGLFASGIALAVSGRWVWKSLFAKGSGRQALDTLKFETNNILKNDPNKHDEMNISQGFHDPLSSIYRLALADPEQRQALLAYAGSGLIGYLFGSLAQGIQETWVRRQETQIRAGLISRMQNTFRKSLQIKQDFDNGLKEKAQNRIYELLTRYQVPNAHDLITDKPIMEPLKINQHYFYEPTHRTLFKGSLGSLETGNGRPVLLKWMDALLVGLGAATGFAVQGFVKLFTTPGESADYKGKKVVYETIQVKDREAWWVNGLKNRRNLAIMTGFFAMSAAAKLGKLFIDGLREIEVTRVNAQTELMYQRHNWLTMDPDFHGIAEEEALENSLKQLERDLPHLRTSPQLLQQRIQAILTNIGRNSAPKYFPMTPPVGLVVARS